MNLLLRCKVACFKIEIAGSSGLQIDLADMLRASHLPSLSSPTISSFRLLPVISSLSFSSLQFSYPSSIPKLPPSKTQAPISPPPSFPSFRWSRFMAANPRPKGEAFFSAGTSEGGYKEILVQHLLVGEENLELLIELQQRIARGVDLSDLAVEYSTCPSKENGGMLGWVRRGQLVPEFEEAAFSAPLNKVVRCKTKHGWHLLQVLSEREESVIQDIKLEELQMKMQDPRFIDEAQLIDVREPEEVALASLPGFKVLPLRQFGTWGSAISDEFDPQKDTYVLCHHGVRSLQVARWLQTQGFKRVFNVAGGIHAYAAKADPSIPTY